MDRTGLEDDARAAALRYHHMEDEEPAAAFHALAAAHLLRPDVSAAAAKLASVALHHDAASNNEDDEDDEDDAGASVGHRLTQHEGLLKASFLEKVASEKRLRKLSEPLDREAAEPGGEPGRPPSCCGSYSCD